MNKNHLRIRKDPDGYHPAGAQRLRPPGGRAAARGRGAAFELSARLLWAPVVAHLLAGASLLVAPSLWRPYFIELAVNFPELSEGISQSMLAFGLLHLLLAGSLLFVLSAYRQRAAWAWWVFLVFITLGWGGAFVLQIKAGVAWSAALSALLVLLGWVALAIGAGGVFRPIDGTASSRTRSPIGRLDDH